MANGEPEKTEVSITKIEKRAVGPEEFLQFLRTQIDVADLIQSRPAQAVIARAMNRFISDQTFVLEGSTRSPMNPYPTIELKRNDGYSYNHGPFMLKDGQFYYYFPTWNPGDDVPPYLRPEDVVPSKTYTGIYPKLEDIPFNKPFCRVSVKGGEEEIYNYVAQQWEVSGEGRYTPKVREKIKNVLSPNR